MTTKALKATNGARIHRRFRHEPCEVEVLMRAAAACRRLPADSILGQMRKLSPRDRSEITPQFMRKRLGRRINALETLASEGSPTSAVGAAYQILLVTNMLALDDLIDNALAESPGIGAKDKLRDAICNAQNTAISAYHALRTIVKDPDLDAVEAPHDLAAWKPNRTVSALLAGQKSADAEG